MLLLRTMSRLRGISLTCGDATTGLTLGSDLGHTAGVSSLSSSLYSLSLLLSEHSGETERVKIFPNTDYHRSMHEVLREVVSPAWELGEEFVTEARVS